MEKIFVVNLDSATDRWRHYEQDDRFTRWSATSVDQLSANEPVLKKMISFHNINPYEHKAKCACYISHRNLYKYIISNKLDKVLILEDDAQQINELPHPDDLPNDGFTYLGGISNHLQMVKGPLKVDFKEGVNKIKNDEYRMLMTIAIYIPTWQTARRMYDSLDYNGRCRAIDTMLRNAFCPQYVQYPAVFVERPDKSQIRKSKKKFSNSQYEHVSSKKVMKELIFL